MTLCGQPVNSVIGLIWNKWGGDEKNKSYLDRFYWNTRCLRQ